MIVKEKGKMKKLVRVFKKYLKKFTLNIKRSWRKLKYLDKTQFQYFVVTSFIGAFCLFTSTTYSIFTISKYLNAATITIAKLSYTLSSTTTGYSNGNITVAAGDTVYVDLTLKSLNKITTKYALNYSSPSSDVSVYYSENLKNNMSGTIGSSGSSITLRVVIVNSGSASATVNLTVAGGYVKNSLSSNITDGYYEQDLVIRTTLLDENFENATQASEFPDKTGNYAYYKTVCSEDANATWDYANWSLNIEDTSIQMSCDVFFKKMTNDIELYYMLSDANGKNGVLSDSVPNDGTYEYKSVTCSTDATATWDSSNWKFSISGMTENTLCIGYFNKTS
jgi:hypothetical protein